MQTTNKCAVNIPSYTSFSVAPWYSTLKRTINLRYLRSYIKDATQYSFQRCRYHTLKTSRAVVRPLFSWTVFPWRPDIFCERKRMVINDLQTKLELQTLNIKTRTFIMQVFWKTNGASLKRVHKMSPSNWHERFLRLYGVRVLILENDKERECRTSKNGFGQASLTFVCLGREIITHRDHQPVPITLLSFTGNPCEISISRKAVGTVSTHRLLKLRQWWCYTKDAHRCTVRMVNMG